MDVSTQAKTCESLHAVARKNLIRFVLTGSIHKRTDSVRTFINYFTAENSLLPGHRKV